MSRFFMVHCVHSDGRETILALLSIAGMHVIITIIWLVCQSLFGDAAAYLTGDYWLLSV